MEGADEEWVGHAESLLWVMERRERGEYMLMIGLAADEYSQYGGVKTNTNFKREILLMGENYCGGRTVLVVWRWKQDPHKASWNGKQLLKLLYAMKSARY